MKMFVYSPEEGVLKEMKVLMEQGKAKQSEGEYGALGVGQETPTDSWPLSAVC